MARNYSPIGTKMQLVVYGAAAGSRRFVVRDLRSGSCEEIGRRIKVATVVKMAQPLDCKREPLTRSSTPGIDRSFPTDFAHRRCRKANRRGS